jgi:hypothetical protein
MNMQLGCFWFTGELAKALCQLFLKLIGQVVLFAEVDNTALRDCSLC